jgi:hypothetical protein
MTREIEVIDRYNARHRFSEEEHYYQWRLKPGTIDIEGNEFLDIFLRCEDDEVELVATFPRPALVGVVTDTTAQMLPMRELQLEQCPRCGYVTTARES